MQTRFVAFTCALAMAASLSAPASALPSIKAPRLEATSAVTAVGWRCGRYWHWSYRWGKCVPN